MREEGVLDDTVAAPLGPGIDGDRRLAAPREIVAELQVVTEAFSRPTLRLLRAKRAPVQVAVLRLVFGPDRRGTATDVVHARVGALIDGLRAAGYDVPDGTGRALCRQWMNANWLTRYRVDDGEVYELTSAALEALEVVQSLSTDRQLLSESRLAAIIEAVRRQAIEASPDAQPRIDRLNAQIERLTAERDRLISGEAPELASDDRMLEGYHHLIDLIGQLPSDFKRVEEGMRALRDSILAALRDDERPLGDTIDAYLSSSDRLLDTPEGRAFEGAFRLLRDEAMLTQLSNDLDVVLDHPFTEVLTADEVRAFRGTVTMVQRGMRDVLAQRQRSSQILADRIRHHDAVRERELAATLTALRSELDAWLPTTSRRSKVTAQLLPERVETLPHVRERFWDPVEHAAPDPLAVDEDDTEAMSLSEALRFGGPLLARVRDQLIAADPSDPATIADAFDALPDDLRRPVEILGVMHLLALIDALTGVDTAPVTAIRPDGTERRFRLPSEPITDELAAALGELELT